MFSNSTTIGPNCQTNINECASNPCLNQGTCIDDVAGYKCNCLLPYTGMKCTCFGWCIFVHIVSGKLLSLLFSQIVIKPVLLLSTQKSYLELAGVVLENSTCSLVAMSVFMHCCVESVAFLLAGSVCVFGITFHSG